MEESIFFLQRIYSFWRTYSFEQKYIPLTRNIFCGRKPMFLNGTNSFKESEQVLLKEYVLLNNMYSLKRVDSIQWELFEENVALYGEYIPFEKHIFLWESIYSFQRISCFSKEYICLKCYLDLDWIQPAPQRSIPNRGRGTNSPPHPFSFGPLGPKMSINKHTTWNSLHTHTHKQPRIWSPNCEALASATCLPK